MLRIAPLIFALLAPALAPAAQEPAEGERVPTVKEAETGIPFPRWLDVLGDLEAEPPVPPRRHHLLGTGVREKTIFRVNVYGFAIYADRDTARERLAEVAAEMTREEALKGQRFATALMRDEIGKTLRLELARNVDGEDIAEAFEDSLAPRVRRFAATEEAREEGRAALATFRGFFDARKIREGDVLQFTWDPAGRLHTSINGVAKPVIANRHLAYSLFDVYLGEDPVSSKARKNVLRGAWSLAASGATPAGGGSGRPSNDR